MAQRNSRKRAYIPYSDAPYVRTRVTTGDIMYIVVLALLPCAGVGMYHYGFHAALLIGISVGTAIAAELVCNLVRRSGSSIYDYSCVVTGLVGGLILPPAAPLWMAAALSLLAIVLFKHVFGGLGRNLFNPAAAGRLVLTVLFYDTMSDYGTFEYLEAPPLTLLQNAETPDLISMLTGNTAGCIGTASAVAVLIAAVILLVTGIIDLYVPAAAILSFVILYAIFGEYGLSVYTQCVQLCGGSFLFTVFIMAQDYTTSPMSDRARVIYGLVLGTLIFLFRQAGFVEEAFLGALLIANAVRPLLDAKLAPRPFGANATRWVVRVPGKRKSAGVDISYEEAGTDGTAEVSVRSGSSPRVESVGEPDEEFARFQEHIRRQTQGRETSRYAGDDEVLQEAMAALGIELEAEPAEGEFESVVTDTAAIRPEAIRAALDGGEPEESSYYTRPLSPGLNRDPSESDAHAAGRGMPTLPIFGMPRRKDPRREGRTNPSDDASGNLPDDPLNHSSDDPINNSIDDTKSNSTGDS